MRKILLAIAAIISLSACTTAENDATLGGVSGALIGGLASNSVAGAAIGGAVGAAAGVVLGRATRHGYCRYRNRRGHIYTARCPAGY